MKTKIKKKLQKESIVFIEKFLKKVKNLTKKDKKFIQKLLKIKRENNKKEAELWTKSILTRLAVVQLQKPYSTISSIERKKERDYSLFHSKEFHNSLKKRILPAELVIETMKFILDKSGENNHLKKLRKFVKESE